MISHVCSSVCVRVRARAFVCVTCMACVRAYVCACVRLRARVFEPFMCLHVFYAFGPTYILGSVPLLPDNNLDDVQTLPCAMKASILTCVQVELAVTASVLTCVQGEPAVTASVLTCVQESVKPGHRHV